MGERARPSRWGHQTLTRPGEGDVGRPGPSRQKREWSPLCPRLQLGFWPSSEPCPELDNPARKGPQGRLQGLLQLPERPASAPRAHSLCSRTFCLSPETACSRGRQT